MPEKLTYRGWIGSSKNDALPIATANKHNLCMKVHANCHLYMQCFETNIFKGKRVKEDLKSSDKTRNRQACRDDYVHNVHMAGLHTSDRLLLEAVREVNLFDR